MFKNICSRNKEPLTSSPMTKRSKTISSSSQSSHDSHENHDFSNKNKNSVYFAEETKTLPKGIKVGKMIRSKSSTKDLNQITKISHIEPENPPQKEKIDSIQKEAIDEQKNNEINSHDKHHDSIEYQKESVEELNKHTEKIAQELEINISIKPKYYIKKIKEIKSIDDITSIEIQQAPLPSNNPTSKRQTKKIK